MEARARFAIVLSVAFVALLVKWFTLRFIAPEEIRRLCRSLIGTSTPRPTFGYLLRSLGWDLLNAALGLMVLACVLEGSNFRDICGERIENYEFIFATALLIMYIVLYGVGVMIRYIFLEAAEKLCAAQSFCAKAWLCGLVLWIIGLLMLLNSSWFVTGK